MGNGYDTEYLCKKVPNGKVYAFDIQEQAVENTKKRLADAGLTNAEIIHDSHAKVLDYVKEEIDGGMFNLGYLPGGDKSVHTMRESTMPAIEGAISLLKKGGILVISIYPGHEEGTLEGQMLLFTRLRVFNLGKMSVEFTCPLTPQGIFHRLQHPLIIGGGIE